MNFYEDFFGYVPVFEKDDYVILRREGMSETEIAIIDINHTSIPEGFRNVTTGLMLSFYVENLEESYEHFYYEGLDIASELAESSCGGSYFMLKDPNDNLITIMQKEHVERSCVTCVDIDPPLDVTGVTPQHQMA